ncbi:hypothetical protein C8F01DRAFT_1085834 [Mycena amicta]|nr:hypothetical protein C8F01DRAFT_1085834 [Mycena amicta]
MPDVHLVSTYLATLIFESTMFGLLLLLFTLTTYLVFNRPVPATRQQLTKRRYLLSFPFVGVTVLCAFATSNICSTGSSRFIELSLRLLGSADLDMEETFYLDLALPSSVAKETLYLATVILGDVLLVHRLWIFWEKSWRVVALPLISTAGSSVMCFLILWDVAHCNFRTCTDCCQGGIVRWGTPAYGLSLLFYYSSDESCFASGALGNLVEGNYLPRSAWLTLTAIAIATNSDAAFFFTDESSVVVAISATLIHTRIGLGWTQERPLLPSEDVLVFHQI